MIDTEGILSAPLDRHLDSTCQNKEAWILSLVLPILRALLLFDVSGLFSHVAFQFPYVDFGAYCPEAR